ncbi:MAG: hypothetical protein AAF495_28500 [Pseudomonadota bacterium]
MSAALPPSWAMGALALHAQEDPHLVDGTHFRLFTDPRLGLPMRPIHIWRNNLGRFARQAPVALPNFPPLRTEITWVDSQGRTLVAPFEVTPDNPVTGLLPTHVLSRCIWLRVKAGRGSNIRTDIFRNTPRGRRLLGARDTAPYALGASDIDGVIVSGEGTVRDLTWLDLRRLATPTDELYQMALPRGKRARFADPSGGDNVKEAGLRVERGAPLRFGLHDEPAAPAAAATSPARPADELAKLEAFAPKVGDALDALLDDTSAPQHRLEQRELLTESGTTETPEATWKPTDLLHTAMHDPTIARWLGFMDVELPKAFTPDPNDVVLYLMWSWWAVDHTALNGAEALSFLQSIGGLLTPSSPYDADAPEWDESPDGLAIFELMIPAVAVGHTPPLRPAPPLVDPEMAPSFPATPDGLGPWLPSDPPTARRQATLPLRGLAPAAGLAFATGSKANLQGLNEREPVRGSTLEDRALLIVPAVPASASEPDAGQLMHRNVPASGAAYRVAQADIFGRWSDWGERRVAAKVRPAPPEPVFDVWYSLADLDGVDDDTPLWGSLSVRVQVPPPSACAAGSRLLDRIRLSGTIGVTAFSLEADAPDPQEGELVVEVPRPSPSVIGRGEVVEAVITGRWIDSAGIESRESAPRLTRCADPRGPDPVAEPPLLDWAARPDATGRARVKLVWSATGAQKQFRIFGCDEARIVQKSRERGEAAYDSFLDLLETASNAPNRAQVLRDHHALFELDWFQALTDEPIESAGSSPLAFQHALSGSLGVLACYKIVAETEAGTAADFAATPLWVWAVPERSGPPRPLLEVLETSDGPLRSATLRIQLMGGGDEAARFRLRRSAVHSDPRQMPVARQGEITLAPGEKHFDVVDDGSFLHDPSYRLQANSLYSWVVELQSPDLPGSGRPGAWSRPSAAVATSIAEPPASET